MSKFNISDCAVILVEQRAKGDPRNEVSRNRVTRRRCSSLSHSKNGCPGGSGELAIFVSSETSPNGQPGSRAIEAGSVPRRGPTTCSATQLGGEATRPDQFGRHLDISTSGGLSGARSMVEAHLNFGRRPGAELERERNSLAPFHAMIGIPTAIPSHQKPAIAFSDDDMGTAGHEPTLCSSPSDRDIG
jgi:hypothetical protein